MIGTNVIAVVFQQIVHTLNISYDVVVMARVIVAVMKPGCHLLFSLCLLVCLSALVVPCLVFSELY